MKKCRHLLVMVLLILVSGVHNVARAGDGAKAKKKNAKKIAAQTANAQSGEVAQTDAPKLSRKERKRMHKEEQKKKKHGQKEKGSKKKKKKSRKKNKKEDAVPEVKATVHKKKKHHLTYPNTVRRNSYRINVLLPLYLDELVSGESVTFSGRMPERAAQGVAFYEGLKLAADSLKHAGFNLDIYIHDIAAAGGAPAQLIASGKLDSADLIIGAVPQKDIAELAAFANERNVNFVSVLSPNDGGVKNNQYFTMLQPTLRSHCEYIIDDMSKKYAGQKVALLYRNTSANDESAGDYMMNDNYLEVEFRKLECNSLPGKKELLTVFDTTRPNVVVIPILDVAFADSLLRELNRYFPRTHFEVYGMPTWNTMGRLHRANSYTNLTVNVTYPFNIDSTNGNLPGIVALAYKKEYGSQIREMSYRGYETLFWYANLLKKYGTIFNTDYKDDSGAPFTKFQVKPRWDGNGSLLYNENRHVYLSSYQGGASRTE